MSDSPTNDSANKQTGESGFLAWLQLLRISALPSAISNILMAYLVVHLSWTPTFEMVWLVLASACLYLGGMVLNDVFDFEIDSIERPHRPLTSGRISKGVAKYWAYVLLFMGVLLACGAGWSANFGAPISVTSPLGRSGILSILLLICIVLYDGPLKRTILAPGLMGCCRTLNILLGASTFIPLATGIETADPKVFFGLPIFIWWIAISIGVLISGITLLGRREAVEKQSQVPLVVAAILVVAGLIGIATLGFCPTTVEIPARTRQMFPLFMGLISLTILRRVIEAVYVAKPKQIQTAVIAVLRSLIVFDAAVCYLAVPATPAYAMAVLALLIPSLLLGKVTSST